MGIIAKPTHEPFIAKPNTCMHGENWCTQNQQHSLHPNPQVKQISISKVPIVVSIIDIIIRSPSNKRPRTTPRPSTQLTKCMKPLQPLLANPIHPQVHEIQLGELKSAKEFEATRIQCLKQVEAKAHK